jgi:hypothetical protein
MLVTLVGHDIVRGCARHTHMPAEDYARSIIGCLIHDIGYVRGLFKAEDGYVVDPSGRKVLLPRGASDAVFLPYHVDRSKMFAMERVKGVAQLDNDRIARDRRHAHSLDSRAKMEQCDEEAALLRAADLIGQFGDPRCIRKANALYQEARRPG